MKKKIVHLKGISEETGVPINTLRYWRHLGIGPKTFRLGRSVVAYEEDVDAWISVQADKERS